MPKIFLINSILFELQQKGPMTDREIELTKNELRYKSYRELENAFDLLTEKEKKKDAF